MAGGTAPVRGVRGATGGWCPESLGGWSRVAGGGRAGRRGGAAERATREAAGPVLDSLGGVGRSGQSIDGGSGCGGIGWRSLRRGRRTARRGASCATGGHCFGRSRREAQGSARPGRSRAGPRSPWWHWVPASASAAAKLCRRRGVPPVRGFRDPSAQQGRPLRVPFPVLIPAGFPREWL